MRSSLSTWTDRHSRRLLAVAATAALVAGACGGDTFDEGALNGATEVATSTAETPAPGAVGQVVQQATTVPVAPTPITTPTPLPSPTPAPRTTSIDYTIASGDVLGLIAERYDVSLQSLLDANPGVSATSLQVGQTITVPAPDGSVTGTDATTDVAAGPTVVPTVGPTSTPVVVRERTVGAVEQYIVAAGDFASNIAVAFGVSVDAIAGANGEDNIDSLFVGQCLIIPAVGADASGLIAPSASLCPGSTSGGTAATPVPTSEVTVTLTPTPTPTVDPNATPTATPSVTATPTTVGTPTPTPTVDPNATATPTPTELPTVTPSPTVDPNVTATATPASRLVDISDGYTAGDCANDGGVVITIGGFGQRCRIPL